MRTRVADMSDPAAAYRGMRLAAMIIRSGGVVAFPTETVYGLGASAYDSVAAARIFEAKGRPQDNPLIVHVTGMAEAETFCRDITEDARRLAEAFWPGPLTIIMNKTDKIPDAVSAGLPTVAVRCPSHPVAQELIRRAGVPVAAPSANLSGRPSTTTAAHVTEDLAGRIPLILDGGACEVGLESTIMDMTVSPPAMLRPGGISVEQIEAVIGPIRSENRRVADGETPKAPGMKYRHYAPNAPVSAYVGAPAVTADAIASDACENDGVICYSRYKGLMRRAPNVMSAGGRTDKEQYAAHLFSALRELDAAGVKRILLQCPDDKGIGLAVMNRVKKASGGDIRYLHDTVVIGITGGSGAGKSTAAQEFARLGAKHIDCDALYRRMTAENEELRCELVKKLGAKFKEDGRLDSRELGARVFADPPMLETLNGITRSFVVPAIEDELDCAERAGEKCVVLDAPTLFESGADALCRFTVAVTAPFGTKISRQQSRDGVSQTYAAARADAKDNSFYTSRADFVIENSGSKEELLMRSEEIYRKIMMQE